MPTEIDTSRGILVVRQSIATVMIGAWGDLPEARRDALSDTLAQPSPVDALVQAMEASYGAITEMATPPDEVLRLCAQAAFHVYSNGWHAKTDRAIAIYQVCRRHLGLTADASTPNPAEDPAPL